MGRKAKIVAVSIDKEEEVVPQVDEEVKTDAQLMTEIINEVNAPEGLCLVQEEEVPVVEDQGETPVVVAKAKAKRVSEAKTIVTAAPVEPEVVDAEVVVAVEPIVVEPKVDAKLPALTVGNKCLQRP